MAQRHQNGHLRRAKRRSGPVWEFLWRETGADGKRHQRTLVIGSLKEFRTERDALAQIQLLELTLTAIPYRLRRCSLSLAWRITIAKPSL